MSLDFGSLDDPQIATANSRPSGQGRLLSAGEETMSAGHCRGQWENGIMENETERTFLSCVKVNPEPGNDIVTLSGDIGPVEWTDDPWGKSSNERSGQMLAMICQEFSMRKAAIPTHFLFNDSGDPSGERTPGCFNRSRLCGLIREGHLEALIQGDVIYGVVPTQKGLEFVAGADHHS